MRLTWLCAVWQGFLLPGSVVLYLHFFFPFPPSVSLLQAGTEEDVVYPGKLPIVSGGNSLWEGAPRERGSATQGEANHGCFWRSAGAASVHPLGSDARGKLAIPWDWRRRGDRGNKREQWRDKTQIEKRGEDNGGKQKTN